MGAPLQASDQEERDAEALIAFNQRALDDDTAEHRAYKRGEQVGYARGLVEGRGAVVLTLRAVYAQLRSTARSILGAIIERIEIEGESDPAGYERGRAACLADTTDWLELTVYPGKRGASLARRLEDRERSFQQTRAAERASKGGEGR